MGTMVWNHTNLAKHILERNSLTFFFMALECSFLASLSDFSSTFSSESCFSYLAFTSLLPTPPPWWDLLEAAGVRVCGGEGDMGRWGGEGESEGGAEGSWRERERR